MTCQDSFHEVAFNISFWTRNISSARILFWRGVILPHVEYCEGGVSSEKYGSTIQMSRENFLKHIRNAFQ